MKTTAHTLHICQILAHLETKRTSSQDRFQATAEGVLPTLTLHKAQAGPQNNETGFAITELKEETNLTFECFGVGGGGGLLLNCYLYFIFSQPTCTSDKAQPQLASASRVYVKLHKKMNPHRQIKHRTEAWNSTDGPAGRCRARPPPGPAPPQGLGAAHQAPGKGAFSAGSKTPPQWMREEGWPHPGGDASRLPKPTGEGKAAEEEQHRRRALFKNSHPRPRWWHCLSPDSRAPRPDSHHGGRGSPWLSSTGAGSRSLPARPPLAAAGGPGSRPRSACAGPRAPNPVRAAHAAGAGHARGGAAGEQGRARGRGGAGAAGRGLGFPPPAAPSGPGSPPEARALLTAHGLKRPKTRSDGAKRHLMATTSWQRRRSAGDPPNLPVPAALGATSERQTRTRDGSRSSDKCSLCYLPTSTLSNPFLVIVCDINATSPDFAPSVPNQPIARCSTVSLCLK